MSPTRRYFRKAIPPPEPAPLPRSAAWDAQYISSADPGDGRRYIPAYIRAALQRSKAGKACHAKGKCKSLFTPEKARKAALKRWRTRNRIVYSSWGGDGMRIGQMRKRAALAQDYAALRNRYAEPRDDWKVRYDPELAQWFVRDAHGERKVRELTALKYAGVLKRRSLMGKLPRTFRGIDLKAEGWNPD